MRIAKATKLTDGASPFLVRLARDSSGNTLMIVASALVPILAMVGGGIDMGRGYLSQSRLQQACDAGVLAARKKLGKDIITTSTPSAAVQTEGDKFFNANFKAGAYGTSGRSFTMSVEANYEILGNASVQVPTTLMFLFGYQTLNVAVTCKAKLNFSNTDVMMVLDTTGSMLETNPDDTKNRLEVLKDVVKSFHGQLEAAKTPGTRMRYGFVPYSTNVNVGWLLKSDWLVDSGTYEGREAYDTGKTYEQEEWSQSWPWVSGTFAYGTTYFSATCTYLDVPATLLDHGFDADGTEWWKYERNGTGRNCSSLPDGGFNVTPFTYTNYIYYYKKKYLGTKTVKDFDWTYKTVTLDVSKFKSGNGNNPPVGGNIQVDMGWPPEKVTKMNAWMNGCIEERKTYEITDYNNVDFTKALDLDIDLVPNKADPDTQWKPQLPDVAWARALTWSNWSSWPWSVGPSNYAGEYISGGWSYGACPAASKKLAEMNATDVATYVNGLVANGSTYHDIGMIWGGRLLSPTGIFASENADIGGSVTNRHLIFLTDGLTAPLEMSYSSYGIEGISRKRWTPGSATTLTQTVEKRFTVACQQVKNRNINVWVIGFGTSLNSIMTDCAGPGHYFVAKDAATLNSAFSKIAEAMGDLRISK